MFYIFILSAMLVWRICVKIDKPNRFLATYLIGSILLAIQSLLCMGIDGELHDRLWAIWFFMSFIAIFCGPIRYSVSAVLTISVLTFSALCHDLSPIFKSFPTLMFTAYGLSAAVPLAILLRQSRKKIKLLGCGHHMIAPPTDPA